MRYAEAKAGPLIAVREASPQITRWIDEEDIVLHDALKVWLDARVLGLAHTAIGTRARHINSSIGQLERGRVRDDVIGKEVRSLVLYKARCNGNRSASLRRLFESDWIRS